MAKYKCSKCDYVGESSDWNNNTNERYETTNDRVDIDNDDLEEYIYVCPNCHNDVYCERIENKEQMKSKKYLLLCNRHNSSYGDNYCLWWGNKEQQGGYTSDVRLAHRFTEKEIKEYEEKDQDIAIPIELLKLSEDYESAEIFNENLICLVEKGTINKLMKLQLKPLFQDENEEYIRCPKCLSSDYDKYIDAGVSEFVCNDCNCKFSSNDC